MRTREEKELEEKLRQRELLASKRDDTFAAIKRRVSASAKTSPTSLSEHSFEYVSPQSLLAEFELPPDEASEIEKIVEEYQKVSQQLAALENELVLLRTRELVSRAKKSERTDVLGRYFFLLLACALLAILAYVFRQAAFAAIPLVGLVTLIVLWPVFEKFRLLERISAEFRPSGINIIAAATATDEYLHLQGEVAKKEVQLKIAKLDRQIGEARFGPTRSEESESKNALERRDDTRYLS